MVNDWIYFDTTFDQFLIQKKTPGEIRLFFAARYEPIAEKKPLNSIISVMIGVVDVRNVFCILLLLPSLRPDL